MIYVTDWKIYCPSRRHEPFPSLLPGPSRHMSPGFSFLFFLLCFHSPATSTVLSCCFCCCLLLLFPVWPVGGIGNVIREKQVDFNQVYSESHRCLRLTLVHASLRFCRCTLSHSHTHTHARTVTALPLFTAQMAETVKRAETATPPRLETEGSVKLVIP